MVSAKLAEFEAEIDRQEARLARATEANVVTLHPAAIAIYLDAVEQLAKALSASDAKAACLKLRELIDCIVVAPRVKPGDPIHFEVRGRLAALMQPDPGRASVGALVPRGGLPLLNKFKYLFAKWDLDRTIESHSVFFIRSHRDQFRLGTGCFRELMSEWIGAALRRGPACDDQTAPNQSFL